MRMCRLKAVTAEEETAEDRASQIDTSVPVQAGSRIAAVSKNVNGEFWDLIRQGMEDAVEDINTAYGFEGGRCPDHDFRRSQ